jgi:hypothetical protein
VPAGIRKRSHSRTLLANNQEQALEHRTPIALIFVNLMSQLMSTDHFPTPPFENLHHRQSDFNLASEISDFYGAQDGWNMCPTHPEAHTAKGNYPGFTLPFDNMPIKALALERVDSIVCSSGSEHTAAANMIRNQNVPMVSPPQPHFDPSDISPQSYSSSTFDLPNAHQSTHMAGGQQVPSHHGSSSSQTSHDSYPPSIEQQSVGRKRKSESLELGSARAVYLEKNRKAASKCRNKQKRQQEDLVEETRNIELRNRLLKAEVEMLRANLRQLMDIVGLHSNCADSRLKLYVQREANRLATGSMLWTPFAYPEDAQTAAIPTHEQQ